MMHQTEYIELNDCWASHPFATRITNLSTFQLDHSTLGGSPTFGLFTSRATQATTTIPCVPTPKAYRDQKDQNLDVPQTYG